MTGLRNVARINGRPVDTPDSDHRRQLAATLNDLDWAAELAAEGDLATAGMVLELRRWQLARHLRGDQP